VHEACELEAHRQAAARGHGPCHDCAFRRGSHEAENGWLRRLAEQRDPFYCHQAMPLDGRGIEPADGDFAPRDHARYPLCAGWVAARKARSSARALARAVREIRRRSSARRSPALRRILARGPRAWGMVTREKVAAFVQRWRPARGGELRLRG